MTDRFFVCNVCLRVFRDEDWVDAEELIREIRSYDQPVLPTFASCVCPDCVTQPAVAA